MGVEAGRVALRQAPDRRRARASCRSPPPRRPTPTRRTPPRSTPRSACRPTSARVRRRRRRPLRRRAACAWPSGSAAWPCSSDIRTGLPGGADESDGGDAAVALAVRRRAGRASPRPIGGGVGHRRVHRPLARARATRTSQQWEERFGEHAYVPLVEQAVDRRARSRPASPSTTSTTSSSPGCTPAP